MKVSLISIFLFAFLLVGPIPNLAALNYYVDATNGDDNNLGTSADQAWQTITKINNKVWPTLTFSPGDQILFKRGEVWEGVELSLPVVKGASGNNIVFGAYPDDDSQPLPVIDGSLAVTGTWTSLGGNVYSIPLATQPYVLFYDGTPKPYIKTFQFSSAVPAGLNPGAVLFQPSPYRSMWVTSRGTDTVSGIAFRTLTASADVKVRQIEGGVETTWGTTLGLPTEVATTAGLTENGHWYWDSGTLYLYSDVDPSTIEIRAGKTLRCIRLYAGGQYVTLQDLALRGANDVGLFVGGSSDITVQRLNISGIGGGDLTTGYQHGILLFNSNNNMIRDNVIENVLVTGIALYGSALPGSSNNTITQNTILNAGAVGIGLSTDGSAHVTKVSGNTISSNTIIGSNALAYDSAGIYMVWPGSNTIEGNTVVYGGSDQLRGAGIMLDGGSNASYPLTLQSNIITNNSNSGIVLTGDGHQVTDNRLTDNGSSIRPSGEMVLFHVSSAATNITITGNRMRAESDDNFIFIANNTSISGHTINSNDYFGGSGTPFYYGPTAGYYTIAQWQGTAGYDALSAFSDVTRYVSQSGDDKADTNDCLDKADPCATIQRAVDLLGGSWETVEVAQGSYGENVAFAGSAAYVDIRGGWDSSFTSRSMDASLTTVQGQATAPVLTFTTDGVSSQLNVQGLTLSSGNNTGGFGGGIKFDSKNSGSLSAEVERIVVKNNSGQTGGGVSILGDAAGTADVLLRNCLVVENTAETGTGVYVNANGSSTAVRAKILNCTVTENSETAIDNDQVVVRAAGGAEATVQIGNSILWPDPIAANEYGLHVIEEAGSTTTVSAMYTIVDAVRTSGAGTPSYAPVEKVLTDDPTFMDAANSNYRLQASSPGMDRGTNNPFGVAVGLEDVYGTFRITDSLVDMGAYEYSYELSSDLDNDGIPYIDDNCPDVGNPYQFDLDGDGIGLMCDTANDDDLDGITNDVDNCPSDPNPNQYDTDNDGVGNVCEPGDGLNDADGDGIADGEDNCPNNPNPKQYDTDNDGTGNVCEPGGGLADSDSDGWADGEDNCPDDPNPYQYDTDNDTIGTVCDPDEDTINVIWAEGQAMKSLARVLLAESRAMTAWLRYLDAETWAMNARDRYIAMEEAAMAER